MRYTTVEDVI